MEAQIRGWCNLGIQLLQLLNNESISATDKLPVEQVDTARFLLRLVDLVEILRSKNRQITEELRQQITCDAPYDELDVVMEDAETAVSATTTSAIPALATSTVTSTSTSTSTPLPPPVLSSGGPPPPPPPLLSSQSRVRLQPRTQRETVPSSSNISFSIGNSS